MITPMKSRTLTLRRLVLNKETLANLAANEVEMVFGGKKKPKTKPLPMTLGPTCDPPQTAHCGGGTGKLSCATC